jgi:hypothetical protein
MYIAANDSEILSLMKITDQNGTVIPWEFNSFPDNQVQFKILKSSVESATEFHVKVSLSNPIILDLFNQCNFSLRLNSVIVNYLYGARCDKGESGDYWVSNVAYQMITRDINNAECIQYLAPHCNQMLNPDDAIYDLPDCVKLSDYDCVIFPDESAYLRFSDQIAGCAFTICKKHRDQESGSIISHKIPDLPEGAKKVILIDDLCDGGATFISVKNALPEHIAADLFIFHGVFSKCAPLRLFKHFDNIYVSNSLPHVEKMKKVFDLWKNKTISYKDACGVFCVDDFVQYKDFVPGNLVVFDVWK